MTRGPGEPVVLPSAAGSPGLRLGLIPAGDGQAAVHIELSGVPVPYVERQRAFQKGVGGQPITYSYKAGTTRTYQNWLRDAAMRAMGDRPPLTGPLVMTMTAYMPMPKSMRKADRLLAEQELLPVTKRPDTTNLLKAIEDAFKHVVWGDDSQVSDHMLRRRYSPRPRLVVEVRLG